jgi:hypothetical protein
VDKSTTTFQRHPSLINWTWPYIIRRRSYLPRKGFAPLITESTIGFHQLIWDTMKQVWDNTTTTTTTTNGTTKQQQHMIWGSEELDRFGPTPWSHRNGIHAIQQVAQRMTPTHLDFVINDRQPRHSQWISIWKQLHRSKRLYDGMRYGSSYGNFLGDPQEADRIWEYLDCVSNPLGLISTLFDTFATTTTIKFQTINIHLMDMKGIENRKRDISHVIASF